MKSKPNKEFAFIGLLAPNCSVDPEWFISDRDPALNCLSSGSRSRQRSRSMRIQIQIQLILIVFIFRNNKNTPYIQSKRRIYHLLTILYFLLHSYSTNSLEFTALFICSFTFCWIWIRNYNSGSRQKFRIHPDPHLQLCLIEHSLKVEWTLPFYPLPTWSFPKCSC